MATRLKPSRINVDNNPRVGDGAAYQNDNDFHWSEGGGDMSYEDFEWVTLTGNSLVIENISNNVTPTGNFTVSAGTLRPGIEYVLRVNTGNTPYTMTLGTGVTNPNGYSTELAPNKVNQFKFIATSDSQLELEGVDTSDFVTLGTQQTITAKKTFNVEPELGTAKTTDATNTGTAIATEAQVYKKQDKLVSGTNIKTVNNNSLLGSGNLTLNDVKVSSTAPSSPTEGMVWYDTTNDQLKVYDGTNWNVTGKEYNAGEGIEIGDSYSAMQGPAPSGFHVPLNTEWQAVRDTRVALGGGSGADFGIALKLPFAGRRGASSANVSNQGTYGHYWSCFRLSSSSARLLYFSSANISPQYYDSRAYGYSVRCFKNSPTIPTSTWTKLYGTSIEAGGIFWSSADGLISLSSDGQTWITISDKNLGATTVWNSGDTLSEANCGKYYQRGNNYGFPRTGTIANQSTTQVDASNYGPGNYYSSDTFIKYSGRWDSTDNGNLRGGETGVIPDAITNTGVLSVNGETGNVTLDADDISDSTTTNKFVTATEKSTWSGKQDALTLPTTPTQGNLVVRGANNKTLADGGAVPTNKAAASGGTADSLVTTGDKYNWNNKADTSIVDNTAFSSSWDGDTTHAPSKNAVYDVLGDVETLLAAL